MIRRVTSLLFLLAAAVPAHAATLLTGVVEDVTDIILNLKKIPFRVHGQEATFMTLDAKGPGEVTAGQFQGSHLVEVIDPEAGDLVFDPLLLRFELVDADPGHLGLRRPARLPAPAGGTDRLHAVRGLGRLRQFDDACRRIGERLVRPALT